MTQEDQRPFYTGGSFSLAVDIAKRICRCRACQGMIHKGDTRLVIQHPWRTRGSQQMHPRHFIHASCITALLGKTEIVLRCPCGKPAAKEKHYKYLKTMDHFLGRGCEYLCEGCVAYCKRCDICQNWGAIQSTSEVVSDTNARNIPNWITSLSTRSTLMPNWPIGLAACKYCADSYGLETIRTQKIRERQQAKLDAEMSQIRRLVREGVLE